VKGASRPHIWRPTLLGLRCYCVVHEWAIDLELGHARGGCVEC